MNAKTATDEASAATDGYADVEHRLTCAIGVLAAVQHDEGIDHEDAIEELRQARNAVDELRKRRDEDREQLRRAHEYLDGHWDKAAEDVTRMPREEIVLEINGLL